MDRQEYSWKDLGADDKALASRIMGQEMVKLSPIGTDTAPLLERDFPVKAVLFDIYGTVLISGTGDISLAQEKGNSFSLTEALHDGGLSLTLVDGAGELTAALTREIKGFHGEQKARGADFPEVDIITIWDRVLASFDDSALLDGSVTMESLVRLSAYHEIVSNPVWEMPGAFSVLPALAGKGLELGIVSNAQYYTPLAIEYLAGRSLADLGFDEILCSWSYKVLRGKPSPRIFDAPLAELAARGIQPEEVLYVGNDMLNDIYTAAGRGCRTALFAGDKRSLRLREGDERCNGLKPDLIITELSQLEELL